MRGSWRPNKDCNILTPTLMAITVFLFRSPGLLNRGPGSPASLGHDPHSGIFSPTDLNSNCWVLVLSTASYLQLIWTSCRRGYIIIWRPPFFLRTSQFRTRFSPSTVKVISWYSSTGCTCYLHRCISYFDSSAGVNMQHIYIYIYMCVYRCIYTYIYMWVCFINGTMVYRCYFELWITYGCFICFEFCLLYSKL